MRLEGPVIIRELIIGILGLVTLSGSPAVGQPGDTSASEIKTHYSVRGIPYVGFGEASITPDWPVRLSYGRQQPTTARYDEAMVHVMLIEVKDKVFGLLEFDVIGIRRGDSQYIKQQVGQAADIPPENLMVAATHNHSYPRAYKDTIRNFMTQRAIEAARNARKSMFEARIGTGKTYAREDLNLNRAELNGISNPLLYVMRIENAGGHLKGLHYNYGTHPTIFTEWGHNRGQMGPGWPGYVNHYVSMRKKLDLLFRRYEFKEAIDAGPFVMFSEGAAGDQQPRRSDIMLHGKQEHRSKVFGEKLAREVLGVLEGTSTDSLVDMELKSQTIQLPLRNGKTRKSLLQTLVIDSTALVTIPGELGVDLAYRFEEESPYEKNILITNANDYIGYIVPEKLAWERVTYQAKGDYYHPHYGEHIIDRALAMLNPSHDSKQPVDPDTLFGSIQGTVDYEGKNTVGVGVMRKPSNPNYAGGFWGQRTVIDEEGHWKIDSLMPGTFYIYLGEADPEQPRPRRLKSGYDDIRDLMYGYPVTVKANETTKGVYFDITENYTETNVERISWKAASFEVSGFSISGSVQIEGTLSNDESLQVGVYPADLHYRMLLDFLQDPVLSVQAEEDGTFEIKSLPPGRYRLAVILDVNRNGIPEKKIDHIIPPRESPIFKIGVDHSVLINH